MCAPLTDTEYAFLLPLIPENGRPAQDRRRVLDAIFHVALSRRPWRELPEHLGKPDSASRQLRRWMQAGVMDGLLRAAVTPAFGALRHRICWAWRRAAQLARLSSLALARRIAPFEALPCAPCFLPDPALSETLQKIILRGLKNPGATPLGFFSRMGRLLAFAGGNRRKWQRW